MPLSIPELFADLYTSTEARSTYLQRVESAQRQALGVLGKETPRLRVELARAGLNVTFGVLAAAAALEARSKWHDLTSLLEQNRNDRAAREYTLWGGPLPEWKERNQRAWDLLRSVLVPVIGDAGVHTYDDVRLIPWFNTLVDFQYAALVRVENRVKSDSRLGDALAAFDVLNGRLRVVAQECLREAPMPRSKSDAHFQGKLIYFAHERTWGGDARRNARSNASQLLRPLLGLHARSTEEGIPLSGADAYLRGRRGQLAALAAPRGYQLTPVEQADFGSWSDLAAAAATFAVDPDPPNGFHARAVGHCAGAMAASTTEVDPVLVVVDVAIELARHCMVPYQSSEQGMVDRRTGGLASPRLELPDLSEPMHMSAGSVHPV